MLALALTSLVAACNTDKLEDKVDNLNSSDVKKGAQDLAQQCGLECPKIGIAEGNAAISGVTSVDAFFGAVIDYRNTAASVNEGMEAQLDAIRADFGFAADADVAAQLQAGVSKYCKDGIALEMEPARCVTDVQSVVQAAASCDTDVDPGETACQCKGRCIAKAMAETECSSESTLTCSVTSPSAKCDGMCQGSCSVSLKTAASCAGTCRGKCDGACTAFVSDGDGGYECAGVCAGKCTGECTTDLATAATCKGECSGSCMISTGSADCQAAVSTECTAKADASVMCKGRCEGQVEPPKAKAECEASAKARAELHVECTPPHLALHYELASVGSSELAAQAKFVVALHRLETRMPALVAARAKAESVVSAGDLLASSAKDAVKASWTEAKAGKISVKETIGLGCALGELDDVEGIVTESSDRLNTNVTACTALEASMGGST